MRAILTLAFLVVSLEGAVPEVKYQDQLGVKGDRLAMSDLSRPAQSVDATQALNLSAGVSNCKVSRGRSLS